MQSKKGFSLLRLKTWVWGSVWQDFIYLACGHEKISFPYYRYPGGCRSQKKTPSLLLIRPNSLYYPTHIICSCNTICFFLPSLSLCIIFLPSVHSVFIVYAATQNKEFAQLLINWQNKFSVHVSHSFSKPFRSRLFSAIALILVGAIDPCVSMYSPLIVLFCSANI